MASPDMTLRVFLYFNAIYCHEGNLLGSNEARKAQVEKRRHRPYWTFTRCWLKEAPPHKLIIISGSAPNVSHQTRLERASFQQFVFLLFIDALNILAGTRIDAYQFVALKVERNGDHMARFKRCWLGCTLRRITAKARLGGRNNQLNK